MNNRKYMKTHENNWTLNNLLYTNTNDNNQTPWFNSNWDSNDRMDPVTVSATVAREVENAVMAASMKRSYNWPPPEAPPAVNSLKVSESFICFRFNVCHSIIFNHIQSHSIIFNHIQLVLTIYGLCTCKGGVERIQHAVVTRPQIGDHSACPSSSINACPHPISPI